MEMARKKMFIDSEALRKLYWDEGLNINQIGKKYEVDPKTVYFRMIRLDIPFRNRSKPLAIEPDVLRELYCEKHLTCLQISKLFNASDTHIKNKLQEYGITARHTTNRKNIDLDAVVKFYIDEKLSCKDISEKVNVSGGTVQKRLKELGLIRSLSESVIIGQTRYYANRPPELHPRWTGGRLITKRDYVYIRAPNHPFCNNRGYIFEHRLVMEKHLGRLLQPEEIVHHINGNRQDNRIENLMLFSSGAEHTKHHESLRREDSPAIPVTKR
jgi:hypothetical protein